MPDSTAAQALREASHEFLTLHLGSKVYEPEPSHTDFVSGRPSNVLVVGEYLAFQSSGGLHTAVSASHGKHSVLACQVGSISSSSNIVSRKSAQRQVQL